MVRTRNVDAWLNSVLFTALQMPPMDSQREGPSKG